MAYNNHHQNQYHNNPSSPTSPTSPAIPQMNEISGGYYNEGPSTITSTSIQSPENQKVQLNQRHLTDIDTRNYSTGSLSGATAVGTPRVNPARSAYNDVDSINSSLYNHDQAATTNDASDLQRQSPYGNPQYTGDDTEEPTDAMYTKRESSSRLTSAPLTDRETYDLGNTGDQHSRGQSQNNGNVTQYNNYHRQDDPYYDEEATRHNTLTSRYPNHYENEYTDRDFPGGGKHARQSLSASDYARPEKKRKSGCCSWSLCCLITILIIIGLGIAAFFVWPRKPNVDVKEAIPETQPILSLNPPFIDMSFTMVVEIDNRENWVPYKFNKIDVAVYDRAAKNDKSIATGSRPDYTLQPKAINTLEFPLTVNYKADDVNDPVIVDFVAACSPDSKPNAPLKLRVDVELFIFGIDWIYKPKISVPIPDMKCPTL
ncbi:3992_t:CDS:2 [Funneliformis geosporum]|uniref:19096_t:CDS:1 n=1 Tax=Funneliformis geosporum TaxID=1117311 RepID=A0A9W4X561_9GLOM|nr:3992_t:CDS:2 [Funneliformis geosporum]CAI2187333.1 19096_t:CDS:2 [Funneliformis geosporum]